MSYKLLIFLWFSVWNYLFFLYISNLTDLHQYKTFDAADNKLKTKYEYEDLLNRNHSRSPVIQKTIHHRKKLRLTTGYCDTCLNTNWTCYMKLFVQHDKHHLNTMSSSLTQAVGLTGLPVGRRIKTERWNRDCLLAVFLDLNHKPPNVNTIMLSDIT